MRNQVTNHAPQKTALAPKQQNSFTVSTPNEYIDTATGEAKTFWCVIGRAFENKKGDINITLNALPINGKLFINLHPENN